MAAYGKERMTEVENRGKNGMKTYIHNTYIHTYVMRTYESRIMQGLVAITGVDGGFSPWTSKSSKTQEPLSDSHSGKVIQGGVFDFSLCTKPMIGFGDKMEILLE